MVNNIRQTLKRLGKSYYTVSDLEKIFNLDRKSLLVTLTRLEKRGELTRLSRGMYQLPDQMVDVPVISTQIYQPSYISFEWALAKYGVLSQIPYTLTLATTNRPKRVQIGTVLCEYRQVKQDLLFGFSLVDGIYIACPEKALLDLLDLVSKGKATVDLDIILPLQFSNFQAMHPHIVFY